MGRAPRRYMTLEAREPFRSYTTPGGTIEAGAVDRPGVRFAGRWVPTAYRQFICRERYCRIPREIRRYRSAARHAREHASWPHDGRSHSRPQPAGGHDGRHNAGDPALPHL
jgi:hypothetical protein